MAFQKITLKNGLRVITVPLPHSLTTTILVLNETGSKYETKRINGISHFLEHMCFKGTKKRPTPNDINHELDDLGAESNAFTGHEYTGYYTKFESSHFDKALDVISDIFLNSTLPLEELKKERGVIEGEIDMYEDTPRRSVGDILTELLYGDTPAGWNIAGTKQSVRAIGRNDMVSYRAKHYVAKATVVVIAGNQRFGEKAKKIAEIFENTPAGVKSGKKTVHEAQKKPAVKVKRKDTNQTHFVLGFRTFDIYDPRLPALEVLSGVLGGGMSSRLFRKVREEMGAGYYVGADCDPFTDHGFFSAHAGVANGRVAETVEAILGEVAKTKIDRVPDSEMSKTKNFLIGGMFSGLETSNAFAGYYGMREILHLPLITPKEKADAIRKVTASDIQKLAREIFVPEKLNLALIGPFASAAKFEKLLKI